MFDIIFFAAIVGVAFVTCVISEIVVYRVLKRARKIKEYEQWHEICDACGKNPKAENSMLCKECEEKAYGDTRDKDRY